MRFDFERIPPAARYELLLGAIVPRPIVLVVTLSPDGALNVAPYSLFSVISHAPPVVAFSVLPHAEGRLKDTARNIAANGEFVLSLVSEDMAEAMNLACIDAPYGTDEAKLAGLTTAASAKVAPPRIAESAVSFECRFERSVSFGPDQLTIFGRILEADVADGLVRDAARGVIDTPELKAIGAMHGARWYARTRDLFAMDRPTWAGWRKDGKV
ncbi:MAG: flavin reductase family protein [Pseudorhodoplanes sp.]